MTNIIEKQIKNLFLIARDLESVKNSRHAAAVMYKGKVISIGFSQYKTHPYAVKYQKNESAITLHAEVDAIYKATKRLTEQEMKKATLIVVRTKTIVGKRHRLSDHVWYSKPCEGCEQCIKDHGIKKVVYSVDSEEDVFKYVTEVWK